MSEDDEPPSRAEISLQNPNNYPEAQAARVRPWLERLVADLAPERTSFAVRFVGDRAIRRFNRDYRSRDGVTDVLSFEGARTADGWHLGDVAISVPAVRRQARDAGHGVDRELKTLLLHGVLHCLGYDHERDNGEMTRLESELRGRWIGGCSGD